MAKAEQGHSLLVADLRASHSAQLKAMRELHDSVLKKKDNELKALAKALKEERKKGNKVRSCIAQFWIISSTGS